MDASLAISEAVACPVGESCLRIGTGILA